VSGQAEEARSVLLIQLKAGAEPVYPLGLSSVAAVLIGKGCRVSGFDLQIEDLGRLSHLIKQHKPDWVGCSVLAHTADQARQVFSQVKQAGLAKTFIVGAYPSQNPKAAREDTRADFAIVGPPELAVARLIEQLDRLDLEIRVPTRLSELPLPNRSVFPVPNYFNMMRTVDRPAAAIFTSRGCRRQCSYCAVPDIHPEGFDGRRPEQVYEEMHDLAVNHGIRSLLVEDDSFLADPDRICGLSRLLIEKPLPLVWELVNGIRPDQADNRLFARMAQAGCRRVVYSFDFINPNPISRIECDPATAARAVRIAKRYAMRVGGYFIVGLPGHSILQELNGISHALRLDLDDANFIPLYSQLTESSMAKHVAKLAQAAFFGKPLPFVRLCKDLYNQPGNIDVLARKALEMFIHAGPVPMRDNP
jgi:radical SAM superfamily enzyme YgiQ (UPF0313 family)